MATLSDMMNVRKLIYGHESEEKSYNLNPFCSMLFYESQYYPEVFLPANNTRYLNAPSKQSLRNDIL